MLYKLFLKVICSASLREVFLTEKIFGQSITSNSSPAVRALSWEDVKAGLAEIKDQIFKNKSKTGIGRCIKIVLLLDNNFSKDIKST